jgi:hypothetical protein
MRFVNNIIPHVHYLKIRILVNNPWDIVLTINNQNVLYLFIMDFAFGIQI